MRDWIRRYLGTRQILNHIADLEERMATATEQLTALSGKVDDLISDVRAALAVIGEDNLSEAAQGELDKLTAKVEAFDTEVGDADRSDETIPQPSA
jgi:uncharacterized coiled-coil protein SlyX